MILLPNINRLQSVMLLAILYIYYISYIISITITYKDQ